MANINLEIEQIWKELIQQIGIESLFEPNFGQFIDSLNAESEKDSRSFLEPWLSILEQEIKWLSCFHLALDENCEDDDSEFRVPWALVGTACSQAVAIRKLSLIGLDLPAKAVYRNLIETLKTFIVTIADQKLLEKYKKAGLDGANKIWHDELRTKSLESKLSKIYSKFDFDKNSLEFMKEWQNEEFTLTSQAVHPSYILAALASMPLSFDNDIHKPGIFGVATPASIRTLSETCKSIWLYGRLGFRILLEKFSDESIDPMKFKKNSQASIITLYGFSVIDELVVRHWNEVYNTTVTQHRDPKVSE